jgi:hypothetical protein
MAIAAFFAGSVILVAECASLRGANPEEYQSLFQKSERLASDRDVVCALLLVIMSDPQGQPASRLHAAELLARLHYSPAIPTLVREIDLVDPTHTSLHPEELPNVVALARFGDAAVPELVRAYLKGIASERESTILRAIRRGKTAATARTYALGLAAEGDAATRERVDYFLEELASREENRPPMHQPPVYDSAKKP